MTEKETIYFIYIGRKLPKYGKYSLKIAKETSGCKVHLIGNKSMRKKAKRIGIEFTSIESFYSNTKFSSAELNLTSDQGFRSGFWSKSTERLFVLQQFMESNNLARIMHVELDQLVFNINRLILGIESTGKRGVFIPFHRPSAAVASVIYINKIEALNSLINESIYGESYNNEMELIARWAKLNPEYIFALPTPANLLKKKSDIIPNKVTLIDYKEIDGLVDAAQLGQWIGGIDPRNVPLRQKPSTLYVDPPSNELLTDVELARLDFQYKTPLNDLKIQVNEISVTLFNLHLHSKAHPYLWRVKNSFKRLLLLSNERKETHLLSMRLIQIKSFAGKAFEVIKRDPHRIVRELMWRIKSKLRIRPSSAPLVSGDTFRDISDFYWEHNSKNISVSEMSPGDIIFCESELLQELNSEVLEKTDIPLVVILGNSDQNHSASYISKIELRENIIFYAQNLTEDLPNFKVLPIGVENAWRSTHGSISLKFIKTCKVTNKRYRIMWGFTIATNPKVRGAAVEYLEQNALAEKITKVPPKKHQEIMSRYAFVACPAGNGIDTHRFWEALYFKSIPIVLKSHMTKYYESIGLPVWIIESYQELLDQSEADLIDKYRNMSDGFSNEAIWADYWIKKIKLDADTLKIEYFRGKHTSQSEKEA